MLFLLTVEMWVGLIGLETTFIKGSNHGIAKYSILHNINYSSFNSM